MKFPTDDSRKLSAFLRQETGLRWKGLTGSELRRYGGQPLVATTDVRLPGVGWFRVALMLNVAHEEFDFRVDGISTLTGASHDRVYEVTSVGAYNVRACLDDVLADVESRRKEALLKQRDGQEYRRLDEARAVVEHIRQRACEARENRDAT